MSNPVLRLERPTLIQLLVQGHALRKFSDLRLTMWVLPAAVGPKSPNFVALSASLECFVGQLIKVLLVATGEMAAAAEAHCLHDLAYAIEALVLALLAVDQQLPDPI